MSRKQEHIKRLFNTKNSKKSSDRAVIALSGDFLLKIKSILYVSAGYSDKVFRFIKYFAVRRAYVVRIADAVNRKHKVVIRDFHV